MANNKKYVLAGAFVAGLGVLYANKKGIDYEKITEYIDKNKEKFDIIIKQIVELTIDMLRLIVEFIKKLILDITFKSKMLIL